MPLIAFSICPPIKQIKTNQELVNVVTSVSYLTHITTALRESGKGDDPCVTFEAPSDICVSFTDEQMNKIQHRTRYIKKQKKNTTSSKDDELDLSGEGDGESFTGSNTDLESAADNLFTSSPPYTAPTLQFIVSQDANKNCPTHPR